MTCVPHWGMCNWPLVTSFTYSHLLFEPPAPIHQKTKLLSIWLSIIAIFIYCRYVLFITLIHIIKMIGIIKSLDGLFMPAYVCKWPYQAILLWLRNKKSILKISSSHWSQAPTQMWMKDSNKVERVSSIIRKPSGSDTHGITETRFQFVICG